MLKTNQPFMVRDYLKVRLLLLLSGMVIFFVTININAYPLSADWDTFFTPEGVVPKLSATERTSSLNFSSIVLRGSNMFTVGAKKDTEFNVEIRHLQLGSYTTTAAWELRTADDTLLTSGTLLFDQLDTISYQHNKTEVLYLYMSSGANCYYLNSSDVNIGIFAGAISRFQGNNLREMYVSVPNKVKNFTVTLYAGGTSENVKIKIYGSTGTLITQGETTAQDGIVDIPVTVGDDDNAVWKVQINPPSQGWLEDFALKISASITPILSLNTVDKFSYAPFGSKEKISIMVDKVMAASEGYEHEEWMVDAAKAAGFNTYVPRSICGTVTLEDIAGWCEDEGMKTFRWMRGTKSASLTNSTYDGKRYYPDEGEEPILSPNSDELWNALTSDIEAYATSSLTNPAIQGVFFDFEDYCSPNAYAETYLISYDDVIINKYETAMSITVAANPEDRKEWLINNNYHDNFVAFQINYWRECCQQLRLAVDEINPKFQFIIYPFGNPDLSKRAPFLYGNNAPISQLSSSQAPMILADCRTYIEGPYSFVHDIDIEIPIVRSKLLCSIDYAEELGNPYMLLAGFDPICLENLEFLARAPITGAELGEGFWVFYEGPTFPSDEHTACMDWLAWSNAKIAQEDYLAADTAYTSMVPWAGLWDQEVTPDVTCTYPNQNNIFPTCWTRGSATLVISCQSGTPVTVKLKFAQLGTKTDPLVWELRTLDDTTRVDIGSVLPAGQKDETISFTPQVTGTYVLTMMSGGNAVNILEANMPVAYYAGEKLGFSNNTNPLYINVPPEITSFSLTAEARWGEHVKVSIYSPSGQLVTEEQTSPANPVKVITTSVGSYGSGAWKIITGPAGAEPFEDFYLTVGPAIPGFLSQFPEFLFFRKITVELETGSVVSPMVVVDDQSASGGQYVYSPVAANGTDTVQFDILEQGAYYVWGRVWESDGSHDSFLVYTDDDDTSVNADEYIWDLYEGPESEWKWLLLKSRSSNPRLFAWTVGTHTLIFRQKESLCRIDKIIITKDPNFTPED